MAVDEMVVDHAGRLHEGIDDGRADELEAARGQLLEICTDSGVEAGTLAVVLKLLTLGLPPMKSHSSFEKPGPFSMMSRYDLALRIVPSILDRLRTMPASFISACTFLSL